MLKLMIKRLKNKSNKLMMIPKKSSDNNQLYMIYRTYKRKLTKLEKMGCYEQVCDCLF